MRNINSRKLHAGLVALAAFSSVLVTGCSSEGIVDAPEAKGKVLQLKATINGTSSRSFSTNLHDAGFSSGENVHVMIYEAPMMSSVQSQAYSVGEDGTTLTPTTSVSSKTLTSDGPEYIILGIYPSDVELPSGSAILGSWSFSVKTDQNTDENYNASDLMMAREIANYNNSSVTLGFEHKLAKIVLNLSSEDGLDVSEAVVLLNNVIPTAKTTPFLNNGEFSASESETGVDIMVKNAVAAPKNTQSSVSAVIPPQTIAAGTSFIQVNLAGARQASFITDQIFEGGYVYTYNIKLTKHDLTVSSATVAPWKEGKTTDVTM